MSLSWLLPYMLVSLSVILIPGPDMLFVLTQSISSGNKAGILTILGSVTGTFIHTLLAALGLSIILQQSAIAFHAIKIIGAIYLLYLSIQSFIEKKQLLNLDMERSHHGNFFQKGFFMNLANPKMAIFFLTFLPQFVDSSLGDESLQILMLGIIFIVETIIVFTIISILASRLGRKMAESSQFLKGMKYFKGTVFGGLGLKLLFLSR